MIPKFRAWHKKDKRMCYLKKDREFVFDLNGWSLDNLDEADYYSMVNSNNGILMQSTGLKDKNDREIFEGDILKTPTRGNFEVKIIRNRAGIRTDYGYSGKHNFPCWWNEVIGNIHENPEMLEVRT